MWELPWLTSRAGALPPQCFHASQEEGCEVNIGHSEWGVPWEARKSQQGSHPLKSRGLKEVAEGGKGEQAVGSGSAMALRRPRVAREGVGRAETSKTLNTTSWGLPVVTKGSHGLLRTLWPGEPCPLCKSVSDGNTHANQPLIFHSNLPLMKPLPGAQSLGLTHTKHQILVSAPAKPQAWPVGAPLR